MLYIYIEEDLLFYHMEPYENILKLPEEGSMYVNIHQSEAVQRELFSMGYEWSSLMKNNIEHHPNDCFEYVLVWMKTREKFASLEYRSSPMYSIPLKLIQYASNAPVGMTLLNFHDYFKIKLEYEGWKVGIEYGI